MNKIVKKFLSEGDQFIPIMHLRQPRFTYSACGPSGKNKERIQKFKEAGYSQYIIKNKLHKACFQHDKACRDFRDLTRRTASDKILRDKALNVAKNPKYDGCQRGFVSLIYKIFDKKSSGGGIKNKIVSNKELIIRRITQTIYRKIRKKTSTLNFYRQYLGL